jgi:hypothetical protein
MRQYEGSLTLHWMDGSAFSTDTPLREVQAKGMNDDRTITAFAQKTTN